jgi:hypothetical protein
LGVSELRELRQLREENRKLRHLLADRSLDKAILQEAIRNNGEAGAAARVGSWSIPTTCSAVKRLAAVRATHFTGADVDGSAALQLLRLFRARP